MSDGRAVKGARLVTLRPWGRGFESWWVLRKGRHMFRLGYVALSCNLSYSEAEQRPFRWAKYHATVKYHTAQTLDAMWEILSNGKLQSVLRRSFAPLTGGSRRIGSQLGSDHGEEQHHEEIAQVLCTRYLPLRGKGWEAIHSRIWGKSCRPAGGNNNTLKSVF